MCFDVFLHFVDNEDKAVKNYTVQLKKGYDCIYIPENQCPLFTPAKYTNLGFIFHKPKFTEQDAKIRAKEGTSGAFSSKQSEESKHLGDTIDDDDSVFEKVIHENIFKIFLPVNNNKRPQIIPIEGAPGIGKTMLMKEIVYLWANEKILKEKVVLLYFSLCHPEINKMNSIDDMFYYSCKDREDAKMYANYFLNNSGQGLVVLLDGLDENPQAMQSETFFYDILIKQKIFINACIVITSRPHATTELQQFISYRVEMIGFTDQRRQEFVQDNLQENAVKLQRYIKEHEIIDTLCYIPLNMNIVVSLFKEKVPLKNLPTTQTELITEAVRMTVS